MDSLHLGTMHMDSAVVCSGLKLAVTWRRQNSRIEHTHTQGETGEWLEVVALGEQILYETNLMPLFRGAFAPLIRNTSFEIYAKWAEVHRRG